MNGLQQNHFDVVLTDLKAQIEDLKDLDIERSKSIQDIQVTIASMDGGRKVIMWLTSVISVAVLATSGYVLTTIIRTEQELRSISDRLQNHTHPEIVRMSETLQSLVVEISEARKAADKDHNSYDRRLDNIERRIEGKGN